jgi:glycosyltransferase involved in cell wall biosynthesis
LNVDPSKITVIPCSLNGDWFSENFSTSSEGRYIFMVAGEAPSKNLTRGIQAFAEYIKNTGDDQIALKVAGIRKDFHASFTMVAQSLGIASRVQLLDHLSDQQLKSLYRNAQLFLMPSIAEGFGIPVLEAMASGAPVASSSAASLPEIAGSAALYFDPYSVSEMALRCQEILSNEELRADMVTQGRRQALKFHDGAIQIMIRDFWRRLVDGEER